MKHIVVLGAGKSTSYLVANMLQNAQANDWFVTVADLNVEGAKKLVAGHQRGQAVAFDANDAATRTALIAKAQLVVNMLTRPFQHLIALECLNNQSHMITASYEDPRVAKLDADAHRKGLLFLNEMGLDPGIDHMVAMSMIQRIRNNGGYVSSFRSYGGGLPSPETKTNPLRYAITWNPRNVLMAGEDGALYKEAGKIKMLPFHQVFQRTWTVEIEGIGTLEAYPNRDSLSYKNDLGLTKEQTIIRGTLRYPGWSETWQHLIHLGLTNEVMKVPDLHDMTYRDLTEMCLPHSEDNRRLEHQVANYLGISPTGTIMENLKWLGIFSKEKVGIKAETVAEAMIHLLNRKLVMPPDGKDMVILQHEIDCVYPGTDDRKEKIISTMIEYGTEHGTAIAKTVGLPIALAAKLILTGEIPLTGCHIPTHPAVYEPVLADMAQYGITFSEKVAPL